MQPTNQKIKPNVTQKTALLKYLQRFKSITTIEAMQKLYINNSATPRRIKDLIEDGYEIGYETKPYITHYGKKTTITKYVFRSKKRKN